MKRAFLILLSLALCFGTALAEKASPFYHNSLWNAEDVDLSGVREIDGRLVGVVKLPATTNNGWPTAQLLVDCPLPTDFTQEQKATLHVSYQPVSKQELLEAMRAVGQNPADGEMVEHHSVETLVSYSAQPNIDNGYFDAQLSDSSLSYDPAFEEEYAQAKEVLRELVEALGGDVAQSVYHANRRDAAHYDGYSRTESSTSADISEKLRARFDETEAANGRDQRDFTMVRGLYELYGLPVMSQFYYQADGEWIGASSEFRAAVRDDGTVCFVEISGLMEVTGKEPLDLPALDWRMVLKQAVAHLCLTNAEPTDQVDESEDGRVIYAGYSVITDLEPCWVGMTKDTLVPGWYCVTQQRVAKDNSIAAVWAQYGDAQTLMAQP